MPHDERRQMSDEYTRTYVVRKVPITISTIPRIITFGSGFMSGGNFIRLDPKVMRSEEHTSELQSLTNLVCRLLLEKKKKKMNTCVTHRRQTIIRELDCSTAVQ